MPDASPIVSEEHQDEQQAAEDAQVVLGTRA
jgi:hypothetical protein